MSDVNVMIVAIDEAIDMLNRYGIELADIHACGLFDIASTEELTRIKCIENQSRIDTLQEAGACVNSHYDSCDSYGDVDEEYQTRDYEQEESIQQLSELYRKQDLFDSLRDETIGLCDEKRNDWSSSYRRYLELIDEGKKIMLEYILKLNGIALSGMTGGRLGTGGMDYYVVIIDSNKYPQTAEHISWAIKKGMPEFVTLGRDGASQRRKDSLRGIKTSPIYDRDEWPMACFEEGGYGADVFYITGSDNRGAGSSIGQQMSRIPDGSRIRIRIM